MAVCADKTATVKWLLAHGADPNANRYSGTAHVIEVGARLASPATLRLLLDHGAPVRGVRALAYAARCGRADAAELLLERGADVNEMADSECLPDAERAEGIGTALHAAARGGHARVVALLLERGADRRVRDSRGQTVREAAAERGHAAIVAMLGE
jgi:ankyrin repeat protein